MPSSFGGEIFTTSWQSFDVQGFEVPETVNGIDAITFNVQIPLKPKAVQIKLFGPITRKEELRALLPQVLDGLKGHSNWLKSLAPASVSNSKSYGYALLAVAIVALVLGVLVFWRLSKRAPKGTVLVIAVSIYCFSWLIDGIYIRELRMLSGMTRMLGFAGIILGFVDLVRQRKAKGEPAKPVEGEPVDRRSISA